MHKKTLDMIDTVYNNICGLGKNPFSVNVITYSGHGITFGSDAIAVIPSRKPKESDVDARFINMSALARKLASKENSLNIFILSMCRTLLKDNELEKIQ